MPGPVPTLVVALAAAPEAHWEHGRSARAPGPRSSPWNEDPRLGADRALLAFLRPRRAGREHLRFTRPTESRHLDDDGVERGSASPRSRSAGRPDVRRRPDRHFLRTAFTASQSGRCAGTPGRDHTRSSHPASSPACHEANAGLTTPSARSEEASVRRQAGPAQAGNRVRGGWRQRRHGHAPPSSPRG